MKEKKNVVQAADGEAAEGEEKKTACCDHDHGKHDHDDAAEGTVPAAGKKAKKDVPAGALCARRQSLKLTVGTTVAIVAKAVKCKVAAGHSAWGS